MGERVLYCQRCRKPVIGKPPLIRSFPCTGCGGKVFAEVPPIVDRLVGAYEFTAGELRFLRALRIGDAASDKTEVDT